LRDRKVETGVFESVEVATFELMPTFFQAMNSATRKGGAEQGQANDEPVTPQAAPTPMEPVRFTTRSVIKHGPFPGFAGFGAAQGHTELVLENPRSPTVAKLYGDASPVTMDTEFGFAGGGHQVLLSPAVDTTWTTKRKSAGAR